MCPRAVPGTQQYLPRSILSPERFCLASNRTIEDSHKSVLCFCRVSCLQGNRVAKGPALAKVPEDLDESSPVIAAAFPLELPSPSKIRRVEENAPAEQGMVRCPPLLMQKLWAWITYRRIGAVVIERAGGCGGGEMSGRGRGQTTASQVLTCSLARSHVFSPACCFCLLEFICTRIVFSCGILPLQSCSSLLS